MSRKRLEKWKGMGIKRPLQRGPALTEAALLGPRLEQEAWRLAGHLRLCQEDTECQFRTNLSGGIQVSWLLASVCVICKGKGQS